MRATLQKVSHLVFRYLGAVADFLFGYDFFISYAHRDGTEYPRLCVTGSRCSAIAYSWMCKATRAATISAPGRADASA
jgi:hypothetical protein